ncbi:MAG: TolC family protein [Kiritimatiellae bacterium]|nr:TolC family protein [Kiritimatiellia bacterium]
MTHVFALKRFALFNSFTGGFFIKTKTTKILAFLVTGYAATAIAPQSWAESKTRPELNAEVGLSGYLAYAALNNSVLEAAFNRWQAALEKVNQAKYLPNPKLRYAYFIEEVETRVGPQKQKFGLSQTFPWFGTLRLRGNVALKAANAAHEQYQTEKLQLFYEVKKIYYEYYYLYQTINITKDNITLLKHLESVAQSKYKAGSSVSGVIKAQIELSELNDRLRSLRDLRGPVMAQFNAILNAPLHQLVPWPTKPPFTEITGSEHRLSNVLKENNPELKRLENIIAKEEASEGLARKQSYPHFTLGVDYIDTEEALTLTPDSGKDPLVAMISIDLPLWRSKYRDAVEEAQNRREAVIETYINRGNVLEANLKMALYQLHEAERKKSVFLEIP